MKATILLLAVCLTPNVWAGQSRINFEKGKPVTFEFSGCTTLRNVLGSNLGKDYLVAPTLDFDNDIHFCGKMALSGESMIEIVEKLSAVAAMKNCFAIGIDKNHKLAVIHFLPGLIEYQRVTETRYVVNGKVMNKPAEVQNVKLCILDGSQVDETEQKILDLAR